MRQESNDDILGRECQGIWVDELDIKLSDKKPEPVGGKRDMYIKREGCSSYRMSQTDYNL